MFSKKLFVSTLLGLFSLSGAAQYAGTVVEPRSLTPIENVLVSVEHTQIRTRTDSNGKFSLDFTTAISKYANKSVVQRVHWNSRTGLLDLGNHSIRRVSVYDLTGRSVFDADIASNNRSVRIPSVSRGIYFLRLHATNGAIFNSKINTGNPSSLITFSVPVASFKTAETAPVKLIFRHDDYYPVDLISMPGQQIQVKMEKDPRSDIFNSKIIHSYNFTISYDDSVSMEKNAIEEKYIPADFTFNGSSFGVIGIRYKGSTYSLPNCFDGEGNRQDKPECQKISFKIKFNKYTDSLRFSKMKELNLHSMSADASKMHDMLAYQLFRDMGIYSPRTSYAKVYINGVFQGLFAAIEAIDGRFTKARWPEYGDGNLYKEAWPQSTVKSYYKQRLETNEDPEDSADVSGMVNLARAITGSSAQTFRSAVSPYLDLNYMVRYIAVDRAIKNWDGITAWYTDGKFWAGNHNFFFYQEENAGGKMWLIPWDLDNTFRTKDPYIDEADVPNWNEKSQDCEAMLVWGGTSLVLPSNCDKLTGLIAETCWDDFVKVGEELLSSYFKTDKLNTSIDNYANLIDTVISNDPKVDYNSWRKEVDALKKTIVSLRNDFYNHIHKITIEVDTSEYLTPFTGSGMLVTDRLNNFEYTPEPDGDYPFGFVYSSKGTTVSLVHTQENPLSGSADLLFSFAFSKVEDTEKYSEWSGCGLWMDPIDVGEYKEILVTLRADKQRSLRVQFNSSVYEEYGVEENYGWETYVNSTPKVFRFAIEDLKYPSWANPDNPSILDEVLATFSGISFNPGANFDSNGELVESPDEGFLRIDNIQFIY